MKNLPLIIILALLLVTACTSSEKLTYLNNLPETAEPQYFPMDIPDYRVQYRDILYITVKIMNSDGTLEDLLQGRSSYNQNNYISSETSQFILGYSIEKDGRILLPVIGYIEAAGKTIVELRSLLQEEIDKYYMGSYVECKLLSFKYTVLGEVKMPGSYVNYNNYLTVLEGIGRAGGVSDYGRRDRIVVVRSNGEGTTTFRVNLQDKELLSSGAYFLQPNDLVIVEPVKHKIFNMNLPTYSFILTSVTGTVSTALLLINFLKK